VREWIKPVHERPEVVPGTPVLHLRHASLAPLGTPADFRAKNERYLRIEAARDTGGYATWLRRRVWHTLRSRLIAAVRLCGIWLIPRRGVRLPLRYELPRFGYGWRLIWVTCPAFRRRTASSPTRSRRS
jgi:hypothetical protein